MRPCVKASVLAETVAQEIFKTGTIIDKTAGKLMNDKEHLDYNESSKHVSAQFKSLHIKEVKHANKKGTENVTDEKFAFILQSTFTAGDLTFNVFEISYPFVVIVNVNQKDKAAATIFWDNSFAEYNRVPFFTPEQVSWSQLGEALNKYILSTTGRELSQENLHVLAEKVHRNDIPKTMINDFQITRNQFCKDLLPDRNFSFWKWFYAAAEVIRDQLREPWKDGCIIGFIDRKTAEEYLINCSPGTFLLRFSDSELGIFEASKINHVPFFIFFIF
jgi:signal transducer and activator of transcription 5B